MKRDLPQDILAILTATALLILVVVFFPSNPARIVLGLLFLAFSPGYVLVAALFPRRTDLDAVKRLALSFTLSIVVTALIGLALNYTSWGIRLNPVLIAVSIFILIVSVIAWYRRTAYLPADRFKVELHFRMPALLKTGSTFDKALAILLILAILGAAGTLAYTVAWPKVGERFTEFYLLGTTGQADRYPGLFTYSGGRVISVTYRDGGKDVVVSEPRGRILLAIVNREHREEIYRVEAVCNGEPLSLWIGDNATSGLGPIVLQHGEKWEQEIGFAPTGLADGQKVEFLLYMSNRLYFDEGQAPYLWVDARSTSSPVPPK